MYQRRLFRHQAAVLNMVRKHPEIPYTFLIGGFGAGKSATDVYLALLLYHAYRDLPEPLTFGIVGVTIKLLGQTVIKDIISACELANIPVKYNQMTGILSLGNGRVIFVCLAMSDPGSIYAYNFAGVICDEIDELPPEKVLEVVKAIQERNRIISPEGRNIPRREPWVVFTTTAQGMGGTYQLTQQLKEKRVPYAVIHARTADNTSLAPSQIRLLRALYTPDEAKAFLDGEFVNLTSGRVYPEYNPAQHIYMDFAVKAARCVAETSVEPELRDDEFKVKHILERDDRGHVTKFEWLTCTGGDVIYLGQDFNPGFNTSVVMIEREGRIFIVSEDQFGYVGAVPRAIRERYPYNKIIMLPDANGKEILEGFAEELDDYSIDVQWNSVNPPITERVLAVNRLFMWNQLYVMDKCKKLQNGFLLRDFDDTGKPRKGKGKDALDHGCFVAGTLIYTDHGAIPIEQVKVGDNVLTPFGYRKVYNTGVRRASVISRNGVIGTPEHPVFASNKKRLLSLDSSEYVYYNNMQEAEICQKLNQWFLTVLLTEGIPNRNEMKIGNIIKQVRQVLCEREWKKLCTELFGRFITGRFLKVVTYTIKTGTIITTALKIWSACLLLNIWHSIQLAEILSRDLLLPKIMKKQLHGTDLLRDIDGIYVTQSSMRKNVLGAIKYMKQSQGKKEDILSIKGQESSSVPAAVPPITTMQYETDVYRLSVTGVPMYFANGLLVKNCDSIEYGIWRIIHHVKGYQKVLDAIRAVHHHNEILRKEVA